MKETQSLRDGTAGFRYIRRLLHAKQWPELLIALSLRVISNFISVFMVR